MKNISISIGLILLFSGIGLAQFLSWESVHNLGNVPISSVASDNYGQHIVTYDGSTVKHYLYRNDGTLIWNNLSVIGAAYPAVTSYNGIVRVVMKSGTNIRIDQSTNGGASWSTLPAYTPGVGIHDIDAFSDANGTHITWDDLGCGDEVYYLRYDDIHSQYRDFKNVTDLTNPVDAIGRPKVVATGNKAHVAFLSGTSYYMKSRDLTIASGVWDNFYASLPSEGNSFPLAVWMSTAVLGDTIYAVGTSDVLIPGGLIFSRKHKDATSWGNGEAILGQNYSPLCSSPVALASGQGRLYLTTYESGISFRTYTPAAGWSYLETVEASSDQIDGTTVTTVNGLGVYSWWSGTSPSFHLNMRQKPFSSITVTSAIATDWNLVSVPNVVSDFSKSVIYPTAISPAFKFIPPYQSQATFSNGGGYWVKFSANQTATYTGSPVNSVALSVHQGWNLFGTISQWVPTSRVQLSGGLSVISKYYIWNGSDYSEVTELHPGNAYWVRVNQSGTLTLDRYSSATVTPSTDTVRPPNPPPPDAPTALSPTEGESNISRTPTLSWAAVSGAASYHFQFGLDPDFNELSMDDPERFSTSYQFPIDDPLSYSTMHYWRVQATDAYGSTSDWTTAYFTTLDPPAAPILSGSPVPVGGVMHPYLTWTVPPGMGGLYYLYRYLCPTSGGDCFGSASLVATLTATNYTDLDVVWVKFNPISIAWYFVIADSGTSLPSNHIGFNTNMAQEISHRNYEEETQPLSQLVAGKTKLAENFPNPFNPTTTFNYSLEQSGNVSLIIYNVLGQELARLVRGTQSAGIHSAIWDAGTAPSGIYYARMIVSDVNGNLLYQVTRKVLLMK